MNALNRYLSFEIFLIHIGHGVLFWGVIAILAVELPWWLSLALLPLVIFSIAGWAWEAAIVLPAAVRLWRGEPMFAPRRNAGPRDERKERDV